MTAACTLAAVRCTAEPSMDVTVLNLSESEFWVDSVEAPEFQYRPVAGIVIPGKQKTSGAVMREAPREVTIRVEGRPPETVAVPLLPDDARGTIELVLLYSRSSRWTARWEIVGPGDPYRQNARFIPEESDPSFVQHRALLRSAETGDVAEIDRLLNANAPLRWDTTPGDPLSIAANRSQNEVIERLLLLGDSAFSDAEIDNAVTMAAWGGQQDISTLILLIERVGARVTAAGRADALRNAAGSNQMDPATGRTLPAGPAIRYLIDEAKWDVNTPLSDVGHTALDLAEGAPSEQHRDPELAAFLRAHGGRRGDLKKAP